MRVHVEMVVDMYGEINLVYICHKKELHWPSIYTWTLICHTLKISEVVIDAPLKIAK